MKKKFMGLLTVLLLLGVMVAGCGSGEEDALGEDGDPNAVAFEEEGLTVTWWLVGGSDTYYQTYWTEMKSMKAIQASVGINIEFEVATSYDDYLPMMAAEDYPDIITGHNYEMYPGRISGMYADGVAVDLTDYLDDYMPNFKQILEDYPDLARDLRQDDGAYVFVGTLYDVNNDDDRAAISQYGLALRQDWLDAVGLDVPTNMDEWYEVLTAFKTQDPNGNGEQDEVPMCMASSGWKYFLTAYGIDDDPSIMTDDNGNEYVVYGYMTSNYKEYLTELNKWYTDGLFENMFEQTSLEKRDELVTNNIAGAWKGEADHFDESDEDSYISQLKETSPDAELAAAPWPATEDGYVWCFSDITSFDRDTTIITNMSVKNGTDKAAAYLIDYMLSDAGSTYVVWGIEGESYEVDEDGNITLAEGMTDSVTYEGSTILAFNQYADNTTVGFPSFGQLSSYILAGKSDAFVEACQTWAQGDSSYKMKASVELSAETQQEIDDMENTMKNYITKYRNYFITGQQPLTNYDTYVSNVERLGGTDYVEIWQEAYDNYLER